MTETTVKTPVSEREVKQTDVAAWANKEAVPVLRELRGFANAEQVAQVQVATVGAGDWTLLWTSGAVPTGVSVRILADVVGESDTDSGSYGRVALFRNQDGALGQVGATASLWTLESAAGPDVRFRLEGQAVLLEVQDDGVEEFTFYGIVRSFSTPRP
jgi:hypothetical protein